MQLDWTLFWLGSGFGAMAIFLLTFLAACLERLLARRKGNGEVRVVAERDEARARIVALETENAELRKDLGRAERAIQREGERAFDAGLSEGWALRKAKEVSSGR